MIYFVAHRLCPIFQVSNVTGKGLDLIRTFLNLLPSSEDDEDKFAPDQPLEVLKANSYILVTFLIVILTSTP